MHGGNGCAPHGCGLYPVCVSVAAATLYVLLWVCVCVFVHVFLCAWWTSALGLVTGIAGGVRLIQFCYGSVENGSCVTVCAHMTLCVFMCVCCESLIKYFACRDSEHPPSIGPPTLVLAPPLWAKQPPEWSASVANLAFYLRRPSF